MHRIFPSPLPANATIGITSPASPQRDPARLERGTDHLRSLGYTVVVGETCSARYGAYLAGSDELRAREIEEMFANPEIDAIFCARGGYGSARLLDMLNWDIIGANPKIFVGFSDITALQMAMFARTGLVTFSGALPSVDLADAVDDRTATSFWDALTMVTVNGVVSQPDPPRVVRAGSARGVLLGGNLSVFVTLLGTSWMPSVDGAVLILEDIGEETYRIDRMLNHLRLAGVLDRIAALVFGQWSQGTMRESNTPHRDVNDVIDEYARYVNGPVLANMMYGHVTPKLTLPMGVQVEVGETLRILESGVRTA